MRLRRKLTVWASGMTSKRTVLTVTYVLVSLVLALARTLPATMNIINCKYTRNFCLLWQPWDIVKKSYFSCGVSPR